MATEASPGRRGRIRDAVERGLAYCRSALRGGVNYANNIAWVIARGLDGRRLRAAVGVACGQLSLGAQAGALLLLYWYADQAQADAVVSLGPLGLEWRAREDFRLLACVVALSGLGFVAAGGFLYGAQRVFIRIGEEEMARRLREMVRYARRLPDPRAGAASRILLDGGLTAVTQGCRYAGQSIVTILGAVTPVVGGAVAGVALLLIDPLLTGMLLVVAAFWCLLLYPLMMRQVAMFDRMARGKRAFKEESQALLRSGPATRTPETLDGAVEFARAMIGRRRVMNDISLLLQTGTAVCATLAAMYLAARIIGGSDDWPKFILYLGALRIALTGGSTAPRAFGTVSRYYPRLVVGIQFLQSAARMDEEPPGRAQAGDTVVLGSLADGREVRVRGGDRIALVTREAPGVVQAAFLQARAPESGRPLVAGWVGQDEVAGDLRADACIHLVDAGALASRAPAAARARLDSLPAGVTVLVHREAAGVGAYGESHLLVADDDGLGAFVRLGTVASGAALEAFSAGSERAAGGGPAAPAPGIDVPGAYDEQEEDE